MCATQRHQEEDDCCAASPAQLGGFLLGLFTIGVLVSVLPFSVLVGAAAALLLLTALAAGGLVLFLLLPRNR